MDNQKKGEQLNQFARFLFDEAADKFYLALIIEIAAGVFAVVGNLINPTDQWSYIFASIGFVLLAGAYYLRLQSEDQYDMAETMRRQSVITEALNWPISSVQFSDWKLRASKAAKKMKLQKRDDDYYETKQKYGARKLLEMTAESAFYTRCLYTNLRKLIGIFILFTVIAVFIIFSAFPLRIITESIAMKVAYTVYLILPILLAADFIGWFFRLSRIRDSIIEVESDIERLLKTKEVDEKEAMRLVSEYNSHVSCGLPIHNWLFNLWHDEIRELWVAR